MYYPFSENKNLKVTDEQLISSVAGGDKLSLEKLIKRHQDWIYNLVFHMVCNPEDAKDITQEILIKIITKLGTFRGKSSFRTWVYRIAINHIFDVNRKKQKVIKKLNFIRYGKEIDETPDMELPDNKGLPVDSSLLVKEVKLSCIHGMLRCLDDNHRIVFILGAVFYIPDKTGAEILKITEVNYRKRLSRARNSVYSFMNEKCGLIHPENTCLCRKKTKALLDSGNINPSNLIFNSEYNYVIKEIVAKKLEDLNSFVDEKCENLIYGYPFLNSPDYISHFRKLLNTAEFKKIFNLN